MRAVFVYFLVWISATEVCGAHEALFDGPDYRRGRALLGSDTDSRRLGPGYFCGDGLCRCFREEAIAVCSGNFTRPLHHIPALPSNICNLDFCCNNLTSISSDDFFENVTRISVLDLGDNDLTYLRAGVFRRLKSLAALSVAGNDRLGRPDLSTIAGITTLEYGDLSRCKLGRLPLDFFHNANMPRLVQLDLSLNQIERVNLTLFSSLTALRSVFLGYNRISHIGVSYFPHLEVLDLSSNSLYDFPETCREESVSFFPQLEQIDLSNNNVEALPKDVCFPNLRTLSLRGNNFPHLAKDSFTGSRFPRLAQLELSRLKPVLQYTEDGAFYNLSTLKRVDLSQNGITNLNMILDSSFVNCERVSQLDLSGNDFPTITGPMFRGTRQTWHRLEQLNLARCSISYIYPQAFSRFQNLTHLYLFSNLLTRIPDGLFDGLLQLTHLDLSDNQISEVSPDTFSAVTRGRLVSLGLGDNPFRCSCEILWFQSWMKSNPSLFGQDNDYTYRCDNLPNTEIVRFVMNEQACLFNHDTYVMIVYLGSLVILTFTVVFTLFRYRWHLRLVLYQACRGRGDVRRQRLQNGTFHYDVFVSYEAEDLRWVRQNLMPELEDRLRLRLCLHERDFIPGKDIVDNIVDCVESSKKIMMLFSPNFARSPWCQFELKYCLSHVMDLEDDLIVVFLDDVRSRDMTAAMMGVLKTTTYIQWVDDDHDAAIRSFWGRLQYALSEIIPREDV